MKRAIIAAVLTVLGAPVAAAQPQDGYDSYWADVAVRSVDVYTGDLNLSDPRDRHKAARRIDHAAHLACEPFPDLRVLSEVRDYRDCRAEAFDDAMSELEGRSARTHRRGHVYTREYPGGSH